MTPVFLLAFLFAALAVTALVIAPLRRNRPRTWLVALAVVPLLGIAMYQLLGNPAALDPENRKAASAPESGDGRVDPQQLAAAMAELRTELERNPNQPEGWALLARSLVVQGDLAGARDAWAMAADLQPDDPNILTEAAQARAQAHPSRLFDDKAVAMLEHAVDRQPQHQRARWFLGIAQRQAGRNAEAAATWEPLLAQVDGATLDSLRKEIDAARAEAGLPSLPVAAPAPASAGGAKLAVKLTVTPTLRVDPDAVVFITARAVDGPPIPVAVERHRLADLPASVTLDDDDSLMPTSRLSQMAEVLVQARISASGSADRNAEDIESPSVRVTLPHDATVELVLGGP